MHQSSPAQQTVVAAPGWTTINNIRPPPPTHPHHPSLLVAPPFSSWNYTRNNNNNNIDLSCSQLHLGGMVGIGGEANKPAGLRTLENWEQHLQNLISNTADDFPPEFQTPNNTSSCNWANQISLPSSCVNTLTSKSSMLDLISPKSSDSKHPHQGQECNSNGTKMGGAAKKARIQPPSPHSTFKVRKEKLGARITTLHQLVSPFGKTDTASVLLEAIGYIRFLQSQIEALTLPYLPTKSTSHTGSDEEPNNTLRSRGLCLVPMSCMLHVEGENGADYWDYAYDTLQTLNN